MGETTRAQGAVPPRGGAAEAAGRALAGAAPDGGAAVRPGTPADAVGGVRPAYVAAPADPAAAAAVLAVAAEHALTVVPRGNGTKIDWGGPPRDCDLVLETTSLTGIEHAVGDLVVRAGAGVPVADLQAALGSAGQRLAVDTVVPGSTVGGMVATGLSGPRRILHGPVRDLVIGMTVLRADGVAARSGGAVVKNVAGYDLGKLHTGAYGTLGVIVSVTFRLHPVPPALRLLRAAAPGPEALREWAAAVLHSPTAPSAVELDWPPEGDPELAVLLEGAAAGLDARGAAVAAVLPEPPHHADALPPGWGELPGAPGDTLLRVVAPPPEAVRAAAVLRDAGRARGILAAVRGSLGTGVLHAAVPADAPPEAVAAVVAAARAALAGAPGGAVTVPHAAPPVRAAGLDLWGEVPGAALMRAIKDRFDPGHRLSPGRLMEGI
ncbi:FAD-binding oxidoreductase [Marinitenerispora sediminis]|uniref:FAD-binding protein n=1 Tax=Marinitenerispora sediminis TaxID=1931232 RepID=A0A368T5B7_9ACTN|nr:FAD-binding oxidoreductase [Marinitenerispora sediminis]RCV50063.1 FAD-binding protein [Marinitenerispora sediminis]RCV53999.1 FAD-binding protein [Marinitenerispora sediminis]RCV58772.1 FAD-binding protein [Marinitenerispora sediminis]